MYARRVSMKLKPNSTVEFTQRLERKSFLCFANKAVFGMKSRSLSRAAPKLSV